MTKSPFNTYTKLGLEPTAFRTRTSPRNHFTTAPLLVCLVIVSILSFCILKSAPFFSVGRNASEKWNVSGLSFRKRRQPSRPSRRASPSPNWRLDQPSNSQTIPARSKRPTRCWAGCRTRPRWPAVFLTKRVLSSARRRSSACRVFRALAARRTPSGWTRSEAPECSSASQANRRSCPRRPPARRTTLRYLVRPQPWPKQPGV